MNVTYDKIAATTKIKNETIRPAFPPPPMRIFPSSAKKNMKNETNQKSRASHFFTLCAVASLPCRRLPLSPWERVGVRAVASFPRLTSKSPRQPKSKTKPPRPRFQLAKADSSPAHRKKMKNETTSKTCASQRSQIENQESFPPSQRGRRVGISFVPRCLRAFPSCLAALLPFCLVSGTLWGSAGVARNVRCILMHHCHDLNRKQT